MKYQEALEKVVAAIPEVDLIDFTREVTRIPSIHGNELAVGKVFATRMSELGMDVREMDVEQDRFNIVGTVRGTGGGRSLMLNGHLDTVGPMLGWTKDPYGAVLEDGKIYGQGISNMKASVFTPLCISVFVPMPPAHSPTTNATTRSPLSAIPARLIACAA